MTAAAHPRRRGRRTPLLIAAALVLAAAAVVAVHAASAPDGAARDMRGHLVVADAGATPAADAIAAMHVVPDTGTRFAVPSVGLTVPLGALDAVDGAIRPPGFTQAYLVQNIGVAPADAPDGTVYVVMHSLRGGAVGPGNYLIDVADGRTTLADGATITVAGRDYRVTGAANVAKTDISADPTVWQDVPGRLVVITCLQRPDGGPSRDNVVITATLADR